MEAKYVVSILFIVIAVLNYFANRKLMIYLGVMDGRSFFLPKGWRKRLYEYTNLSFLFFPFFCLPILEIVPDVVAHVEISKRLGRGTKFGVLLYLFKFPFVYIALREGR